MAPKTKGRKKRKSPSITLWQDDRYEKKSNKFPIKLRITYERESRYFPTGFEFTADEWNRRSNTDDNYYELEAYAEKAAKILKKISSFSFDEFEKRFNNYQDTETLVGAFDSYINELTANGQVGTATNYRCARNSFNSFRKDLLLADINVELLKKYEAHMSGASRTTISMYSRCLRTIINKAIEAGEFPQEKYPFGRYKYKIINGRKRKSALSFQDVRKIYHHRCDGNTKVARDYWMALFWCHGMNIYDLCLLKRENIQGKYIVYHRKKTARTDEQPEDIRIPYSDDLKKFVKIYGKGKKYLFPILDEADSPAREKQLVQQFTHVVNDHMKIIADKLKLQDEQGRIKAVSTNVARHTANTLALRGGIPIHKLSKQMGHTSIKTTEIYFKGFDDESIEGITEVLSKIKKPGKVMPINKTA